jgi:hypothetical protein
MSRLTTDVRLAVTALGGRGDAASGVPGPYLVLDLGRGCDPHQARCRRCRWRSSWRATAAQAQAEHHRHQLAAHGWEGRPDRRGRWRLVISRRVR